MVKHSYELLEKVNSKLRKEEKVKLVVREDMNHNECDIYEDVLAPGTEFLKTHGVFETNSLSADPFHGKEDLFKTPKHLPCAYMGKLTALWFRITWLASAIALSLIDSQKNIAFILLCSVCICVDSLSLVAFRTKHAPLLFATLFVCEIIIELLLAVLLIVLAAVRPHDGNMLLVVGCTLILYFALHYVLNR